MAIVINSKNVYQYQNSKIMDNGIDRFEISTTRFEDTTQENKQVYSGSASSFTDDEYKNIQNNVDYVDEVNYKSVSIWYACADNAQYCNKSVLIPKLQDNGFVSNIHLSADEEGNSQIKVLISGIVQRGIVTATFPASWSSAASEPSVDFDDPKIVYGDVISETVENFSFGYRYEKILGANENYAGTKTFVELNPGNIPLLFPYSTEENGVEYYELKPSFQGEPFGKEVIVLTSIRIAAMKGFWSTNTSSMFPEKLTSIVAEGEYEHFIPTRLEISVYGTLDGVNVVEQKSYVGSTFIDRITRTESVSGNELLQEANQYVDGTGRTAIQKAFSDTLNQYKNGKETATLLCSISDYYDEDGNKALSIKGDAKMTFDVGDIVIPMKNNEKGEDVPMSYYTNGQPKAFRVVGVKMIYDGAVWQELTLQEYTE